MEDCAVTIVDNRFWRSVLFFSRSDSWSRSACLVILWMVTRSTLCLRRRETRKGERLPSDNIVEERSKNKIKTRKNCLTGKLEPIYLNLCKTMYRFVFWQALKETARRPVLIVGRPRTGKTDALQRTYRIFHTTNPPVHIVDNFEDKTMTPEQYRFILMMVHSKERLLLCSSGFPKSLLPIKELFPCWYLPTVIQSLEPQR